MSNAPTITEAHSFLPTAPSLTLSRERAHTHAHTHTILRSQIPTTDPPHRYQSYAILIAPFQYVRWSRVIRQRASTAVEFLAATTQTLVYNLLLNPHS